MRAREFLVREEKDELIIGSGIPAEWMQKQAAPITFGPTQTSFGVVTIRFEQRAGYWVANVRGEWHGRAPGIVIKVTGFEPCSLEVSGGEVSLTPARPEVSEPSWEPSARPNQGS